MRKFLISLLLAGTLASPAAAQLDPHHRQQAREEAQQSRDDRAEAREQARADRSADRPSFSAPARPAYSPPERPSFTPQERPQFARPDRAQPPQVDVNAMRAQRDARRDSFAGQREERIEQIQQRFEQRQQAIGSARDLRQSTRPLPNVLRDRHPPIVSNVPRPGTQPPAPAYVQRTSPQVQWNTSWRNNQHYDWQNYRRHHRSLFHIGFYYDPFGWGYSPYQIGWRMWPAYYGNRYWINDPWMYRVPYAPAGYVWVRYWDDALLVDTFSGEVVDMIPDFFW